MTSEQPQSLPSSKCRKDVLVDDFRYIGIVVLGFSFLKKKTELFSTNLLAIHNSVYGKILTHKKFAKQSFLMRQKDSQSKNKYFFVVEDLRENTRGVSLKLSLLTPES